MLSNAKHFRGVLEELRVLCEDHSNWIIQSGFPTSSLECGCYCFFCGYGKGSYILFVFSVFPATYFFTSSYLSKFDWIQLFYCKVSLASHHYTVFRKQVVQSDLGWMTQLIVDACSSEVQFVKQKATVHKRYGACQNRSSLTQSKFEGWFVKSSLPWFSLWKMQGLAGWWAGT